MCELFAMSSRTPTGISFSLEEFANNGARLRHNRDGWGIAFARDREAVVVKEPKPASDSAWVRFIAEQSIATTTALAHVRFATRGEHTMENTHPFRRTLGARIHLFAHNGTLPGIEETVDWSAMIYRPIGETDSELVFCVLLSRLSSLYTGRTIPSLKTRFDVFSGLCADVKAIGPSNFLYFDGDALFAHADKRVYEESGELTAPKPPGLHIKQNCNCASREDITCPGLKVSRAARDTVLLASVPLQQQGWEPLPEGTVLAVKGGKVVMRV